MILPDLILKSRVNLRCNESGIDSYKKCLDRDHFKNFPHAVEYQYNTRGFRDTEWPTDHQELKNAIWCVGDSFTVGIGSPFRHTWPQVLQENTDLRVINVSMDGASNDWIARQTIDIYNTISPRNIVIMWSYFHRREADIKTTDEDRRLHFTETNEKADLENFTNCFAAVNRLQNVNIVHFLIPRAYCNSFNQLTTIWADIKGPDWPHQPPRNTQELDELPEFIIHELKHVFCVYQEFLDLFECLDSENSISSIRHVPQLDWARDNHHFDILTSQWVAEQAITDLIL